MHKNKPDYSLYLVTDRKVLGNKDLLKSIEEALLGGVTLLQLREKSLSSREFYEIALKVKVIARHYGVPLIINDRLDIALAIDADGLHLGQDDLPIEAARKLMGPEKIIGVSANTVDQAVLAQEQGADYLGIVIYSTPTKTDAKEVGLEGLKLFKASVDIPVVAIGGINESNAKTVMKTGIDGISVVSAILGQEDVQRAARNLLQLVH